MFDLWPVKRRKLKIQRQFREAEEKLRNDKNATSDQFGALDADEYDTLKGFDAAIDSILSDRVLEEARELDIDISDFQGDKVWQSHELIDRSFLNSKARSQLRKLVDEEKTRRFEITTRWFKLIAMLAPVLGAAAGFIGAMIGWVAIHKK
jgi:hypothetical protein